MILTNLRTCQLHEPRGFWMEQPSFAWCVEDTAGKRQRLARLRVALDPAMRQVVWDTGLCDQLDALGVVCPIRLLPRTVYYWTVEVIADNGESAVSSPAMFETGKMDEPMQGQWIRAPFSGDTHPLLRRRFTVERGLCKARLYATGLGLFRMFLNGKRTDDELLTPYCDDYRLDQQLFTWDVTDLLHEGENVIGAMLGKGWYMGRFGSAENVDCLYGDTMKLLCELRLTYADHEDVVATDPLWECRKGSILQSGIYDGEEEDATLRTDGWCTADCTASFEPALVTQPAQGLLHDRLSLPVRVVCTFKPTRIFLTPQDELVVDFGQNMTGYVSLAVHLPYGSEVCIEYGEHLEHGCFCRKNLRTAQARHRWRSDGRVQTIAPTFTYFGFRYVRISGLSQVSADEITAHAIQSDLPLAGRIQTSNAKLNQLCSNIFWGQRDNFTDIPTDCPQRDERMGWTGDAQIFSATACYQMDSAAFYDRYLSIMRKEQALLNGAVPYMVPDHRGQVFARTQSGAPKEVWYGSSVWGDAAVVIPWNLWRFTGDRQLLARHYGNMKQWCDYIISEDESRCGGKRLWTSGWHYGDWLALDATDDRGLYGATDPCLIATAYYHLSTQLTAKAAGILGKAEDAAHYRRVSEEVKAAFQQAYFTPQGRLSLSTQTAFALVIALDLAPAAFLPQVERDFKQKMAESNHQLTTGFVGTYFLCPALCKCGLADEAYTLLLREAYPSWLYAVNLGATTTWERWNAVLPDGTLNPDGMTSLNHYAYGAIGEWMYRWMCGLDADEAHPGFKYLHLRPTVDPRMESAQAEYRSAAGKWMLSWAFHRENKELDILFQIPFDAKASFHAPQGWKIDLLLDRVSGQALASPENPARVDELPSGQYKAVLTRRDKPE